MPVPKSVWLKLPAAQRGNKSYAQYVAWAHKTTAKRAVARAKAQQAAADNAALMPLPPGALQHMATSEVQSQTLPIIKQITASINRQRAGALSDLDRATGQVVDAVTPLAGQTQADYNQTIGQAENIDQGLANFLQGAGTKVGTDVSQTLGAAGLKTDPSFDLGKATASASGLSAAQSSNALDMLLSNRANNVAYLRTLPGVAKRQGLQNRTAVQRDYATKLADAIGQVTQGVPGLVNTTYQNLLQREFEKATARKGFEMDTQKLNAAKTAATNKAIADAIPVVDVAISNHHNDGHAYDKNGNPIPGVPWNIVTPKTPPGQPTAKDTQKRLDATNKAALKIGMDLHSAMMTKLNTMTKPNALTPGQKPTRVYGAAASRNILAHARDQATSQVVNYWRSQYPSASDKWIQQKAAATLASAGWTRAATDLLGTTPTTTSTALSPSEKMAGGMEQFAQSLINKKQRVEVIYGKLVNYILSSASRFGVQNMTPQAAWKTAQEMLTQLGVASNKVPLGDPAHISPGYKPYKPKKTGGPPPVSGAVNIITGGQKPGKPGKPSGSKGPYKPGRAPKKPVNRNNEIIQDIQVDNNGNLSSVKVNGKWLVPTGREQGGYINWGSGIVGGRGGRQKPPKMK